jgi:carnitine-CoA ligase
VTPRSARDLVACQARARDREPFLYFEDQVVTFGEFDRRVNRAASALQARGAGPGTGVAIVMPNRPEWLYAFFATQRLGAYAVPVNAELKGDSLRHVISHCDASVVVCDPQTQARVRDVAGAAPKVETFVDAGDLVTGAERDPGVIADPSAISAIFYTSGTTGAPKGVVVRYGSFSWFFEPEGMKAAWAVLGPDPVSYTCLPLFHTNALKLTTYRALAMGRPVVLSRRFSASRFWDEIRRYGATTFNALGAMIPILMKQPPRPDDAGNPVTVVFSAACPVSVWAAFEERFGLRICEGYAAVDGGGYTITNTGRSPHGSIGIPASPYRIVGDDGHDVAAGEAGELLFQIDDLRARRVEYYKDEQASQAKVTGGWFRTGDLVKADQDGNLYFVDRKTDSLRRRGENISSWEVERQLDQHPAVLESAVFGVPSELGEDDLMAVVVLRPGATLEPGQLIDFAQDRMAAFMVPRYVEFRDALPKTPTHRIRKSELKRQGITPATWDRETSRLAGPASPGPAGGPGAAGEKD